MSAVLVAVAVAFALSIGAHYTGACMGMPHALGAVSAWRALVIMAPLALAGAALASHGVERTVAHLTDRPLGVDAEVVVVGVALAVTSVYNRLRVPTSTIQILVFSLAGTALGAGAGVRWARIGALAAVWVAAPAVAVVLGYLLTKAFDHVGALGGPAAQGPDAEEERPRWGGTGVRWALVAVGAAASFTMGGNDVANATGSLVATRTFSPLVAGTVGGAALALGVLTWGRPLLTRVAFDIVVLDPPMATAAQAVQAVVVLLAVGLGFFTSMNQALVGAMAGAGLARGRRTVQVATLLGILRGWLLGPLAGLGVAYAAARLVVAAGVALH